MNIFKILFLIFSSELEPLLPIKVSWVNLKLKFLLEKNKTKNIRKYRPPIHCEDDLHKIKVGSKYFIFLNIEKPVPVRPEIDSKYALIIFTFKLLR